MRKITQQENEPGFRLNLGEYARILWRKKYFLLIPLTIAVVVSNIGVRFLVPEYESSSVIRIGSTSSVSSEVDRYVQTDLRRRSRDAEIGAQLEADLLGGAFLDELIRRLGMDKDPHLIQIAEYQRQAMYPGISTEELVLRRLRGFLKNRIGIEREGPLMFRISYWDANPEACYVIAEAVASLYIETQRRNTMTGLREVSEFSEEQLSVYKERLDRSEHELERFQEQVATQTTAANVVSSANILQAERIRNDLDLTIRSAEATQEKIRSRVAGVTGGTPSGDRVWSDAELRKLGSDLSSRRESELLAELGGAAPGPQDEAGLVTTQQQLQRRLTVVVSDRLSDVSTDFRPLVVEYFYQQAEIDAYRRKRARLEGFIGAFRQQASLAPQMESELARLRQEVEHNRTVYNTFKNAQTTVQISEQAAGSELGANVTLLEPASRPLAPVRPDKMKILVLAFFMGAAIGGAGLLLTEFSDSSFRTVEEVEKQLGLKVLGTVPRFEKTRWFHDTARKRFLIWVGTSVLVLGIAIAGFYFYGKSTREALIDLNLTSAPAATPQP